MKGMAVYFATGIPVTFLVQFLLRWILSAALSWNEVEVPHIGPLSNIIALFAAIFAGITVGHFSQRLFYGRLP
jgi:uncharacterized membrane protein YcfT